MTMIKLKEKNQKKETVNFKDQDINIGLDVHKKNWSVSIYVNDSFVKTFHQESKGAILLSHFQTYYPHGNYRACYEADFCGFSVQRELTALGIHCDVVNSADVPQTNKGMLSKTDAADSRRIGEAYSKGMLNRFDNFEKFNSYIGFCPSEYSSGESVYKGKMTTRGHTTIRPLILECAWIAVRKTTLP